LAAIADREPPVRTRPSENGHQTMKATSIAQAKNPAANANNIIVRAFIPRPPGLHEAQLDVAQVSMVLR
jgi:hypothetical protein